MQFEVVVLMQFKVVATFNTNKVVDFTDFTYYVHSFHLSLLILYYYYVGI